MIGNYIKTSLRKFRHTKTHTLINVIGLTLGFLCALIIFQTVRFENSYDRYHEDADQIYRVVHEDTEFGAEDFHRGVPYPLVPAFRADFPEAEQVTIVDANFLAPVLSTERDNGQVVRFKDDNDMAFVGENFFEIFHYDWVYGDPATALTAPYSVVLSESQARRFFRTTDVVGRLVTFDNRYDLTVTGVVEDAPLHTTVPINTIISMNLGEEHRRMNDNWGSQSSSVQCYVKLADGVSPQQINRRFGDFIKRNRDEGNAEAKRYFLQPLTEIHYDTRFGEIGEGEPISRETLWALSLIGIFLLLTACINFVNMNTVLVFRRAKEIGVRKVLGGTPGQIRLYFLTETGLITVAALVIALLLANPVMALARPFIGEGPTVNLITDPALLGIALLTALVLTLLSGLYPAFLLSRLHPTEAMRNPTGHKPGTFLSLRRSLVVLQFAISQVLIICTLAAMHQMQYLHNAPLGYEPEAVVEFEVPARDATRLKTMKDQMLQSAAVQTVSYSNTGASSGNTWGGNFYYHKDGERLENNSQVKFVDTDYIDTYQMALVAGANLTPADTVNGFIINESMVHLMGFESPDEAIGTPVELWGNDATVVGVVQDFNTNSLHEEIEATILSPAPALNRAYVGAARVNTAQLSDALAAIQQSWESAFPDYIFEHVFLDERIAEFYESEQTIQQLIQTFALIAILIGCIGLFGLISYTTSQRSKEVGIRKVLGASAGSIVGLFTREFVVLVVLGFAVSAPVAYYVMQNWLENFAYRINLGTGLFLIALGVSLLIALGTVGYKTYRTAQINPVEAIRNE